jgi:perosamine synthetase
MIPLAVPNISGKEADYLQECVTSSFVSSVGPFVGRLETMCVEASGAPFAVATCSGTAGLHLALTAIGVGSGDLVIAPSFTFIATANAISHCGASPWLFDVSDQHWTLDATQVREQLELHAVRHGDRLVHKPTGRRIAAIAAVHTLGHPADMDALTAIGSEFAIPLIADAAAALGARYKGSNIGPLAHLSVISFNGNKTVTAGGGGMVVGQDPELMRRARHLSTTARSGPDYEHDAVGFNYRMTNLQAAVGCAQMERLEEFVRAKQRIDARYRAELREVPALDFFPVAAWATSACWFAGVMLGADAPVDVRAACKLLRERGIEARTFWKPVHLQSPYAASPRASMDTCEGFWPRILTLPCSTSLTDSEQDFVIKSVREILV